MEVDCLICLITGGRFGLSFLIIIINRLALHVFVACHQCNADQIKTNTRKNGLICGRIDTEMDVGEAREFTTSVDSALQ